jgi:hypothetical protein
MGCVPSPKKYLAELKRRSKESRVYRRYQLDGLEIAKLLGDDSHRSLYIKLAKERNGDRLRELARNIAENKRVKNKGAYFMACLAKRR